MLFRSRSGPITSSEHRLAMTRLAFAALPKVQVDAREITRSGPSYTVDTLHELASEHPSAQLFLLIGDDQRRSLPGWHRIEEIARLAIICAAARDPQVAAWHRPEPVASEGPLLPIEPLPMPLMPISATDIRERLSRQADVAGLLAPDVARYIHEHHLYSAR